MSNPTDQHCPQCGAPVSTDSKHRLCASCLMEQAFQSRTIDADPGSPAIEPPSPEEIAPKFPQFEILECLGRGGMGVVYKARQISLNRTVAIKILAPERERDSEFAARFAYEAELLAKLSHPAIVTIHDFGEVDGLYFLVMEYIDGVNLRDVLRDEKIAPREALAIVPTICEALQFAHDQGIVHRDIKPENILLDKKGRVKIADFGIATLGEMPSSITGTPQYMAPEQEDKSSATDHRADIYALGVVFYEMLTGERPQAELIAPSQKVDVDIRIDEIVLRALEKEPEKRYQTAGEFRTVVEAIADQLQPTPPTIPPLPTTGPATIAPSAPTTQPAPATKSGNHKFFLFGCLTALILPLLFYIIITLAGLAVGLWSGYKGSVEGSPPAPSQPGTAVVSNEEVEKVAQNFMRAISRNDAETAEAMRFLPRELTDEIRSQFQQNAKELTTAYRDDQVLLITFTEWYRIGGYAIGRLAPPQDSKTQDSLYLLMGIRHREGGVGEWGVIEVNDVGGDTTLKEVFEEFRERKP